MKMNITKKEKIINIVMFLTVLTVGWFYYFSQFMSFDKPARDGFKAAASVAFILYCFINLMLTRALIKRKNLRAFCIIMLLGQVFAGAGDIGLNFDFIAGAVLFAIGHVLFLTAFTVLQRPLPRDFVIALAIIAGAVCLITFYPGFSFGDVKIVVYIYAVIISCMLSKGISIALTGRMDAHFRLTLLLGTLMFFLSDLMLVFGMFADGGAIFDFLCLLLYYPAEGFLALSVFESRRLN